MVMKVLTQELSSGAGKVELIDGIKTFDSSDAWTLIVPDSGPRFLVQAEGGSEEDASERAGRWASRIETMVG
jgi:hypothetical protein